MISLRSTITKKLLGYFFINPQDSLYVNELARKLKVDKRNLVKKIRELELEGVLESKARGNLKLYSIDRDYPLYEEYRKIFVKTIGIEQQLRQALSSVKGVKNAYLYGSYAQDKMDVHSDIDMLVIGSYDMVLLQRKINKLQKEYSREINIVHMGLREFYQRQKKKDPFLSAILTRKHIRLI